MTETQIGNQTGAREEIPRDRWYDALNLITQEHEGYDVTMEVVSEDLGDQEEAERLPLNYVTYDRKDDVVVVGVGGRTVRFPVLLRHIINHPTQIFVHPNVPAATRALDIEAADGTQTIVTLRARPALPAE